MKLPCEISVWFHLPQIRADLAIELIRLGVPRKTVAMEIGVTRSAISQYIHKKRGRQLSKSEPYQQEIKAGGKKIYEGASKDELRMMVCKCCHLLQEESANLKMLENNIFCQSKLPEPAQGVVEQFS